MKTAYINGKILTGILDEAEHMTFLDGPLFVEGGKITTGCNLNNCRTIDLGGKYVLPGLINMHVHIASSGGPDKPRSKPVNYKKLFETYAKNPLVKTIFQKIEEKNARNLFYSGVTTARTVGGILDFDGKVRDKINKGKVAGPRLLVCNTAVSVPGGHFAGSLATEAENPEMAREHVRKIASTNPDWIKLMITGGVMDAEKIGEPGVLRMSPEITKAACDEAHKLGYKVCAHVESTEGVRVALENGVDSLEHGAAMDNLLVKKLKETGAIGVCTISPAVPCTKCDFIGSDFSTINSQVVLDGFISFAKACMENDIPLGLGTDTGCPYTTAYNTWHELVWWTEALGVSSDFAIYSATLNNAKLLGLENETGSLEPGKSADFIVVDENPLDNLETLKDVRMVCFRGILHKSPKLKKDPEVEAIWSQTHLN